MNMVRRLGAVLVVGALGAGLLAGCSSDGSEDASTSTDAGGAADVGAAADARPPSGTSLSVSDFEALIAQDGVHLIDVRTPEEYAEARLEGATNIDYYDDYAAGIAHLDPEASYALYCRRAVRSGNAMQIMIDAGFTDVVDLSGGITAWNQAGKPVTTG
ncbi:MAG: rhodanese-like domain-containing protein [Micrococcales bacterium]|nr:rhodanese-like domain-containing protein [Micrococcales bacterium]